MPAIRRRIIGRVQHDSTAVRVLIFLSGQPDEWFATDIIQTYVQATSRTLSKLLVDGRLPDGSRLNAVIPPLTSRWTHVTIRKFLLRARTLDDLVALGTLTSEAASFLEAAVQSDPGG